MKMIIQSPKTEGNYLYLDQEDGSRLFAIQVARPKTAPEWQECTPDERFEFEKAWKESHPVEEPATDEITINLQNEEI